MSLIPLNVVVAFFAFYVLIYVVLWVMRVFAVMISVCVCVCVCVHIATTGVLVWATCKSSQLLSLKSSGSPVW